MQEILFRGKTLDDEWVEGAYYHQTEFYGDSFDGHNIITTTDELEDNMMNVCLVIPETIGQYTGLTDKNGTKIFEGDIVKAQDDLFGSPFCNGITGKVVYEETAFFIEPQDPMETQWLFNECAVYEVIGNIHDNPELLGGVNND